MTTLAPQTVRTMCNPHTTASWIELNENECVVLITCERMWTNNRVFLSADYRWSLCTWNKLNKITSISSRILGSIVVSIPACHAGDRGSIPRRGGTCFLFFLTSFFCQFYIVILGKLLKQKMYRVIKLLKISIINQYRQRDHYQDKVIKPEMKSNKNIWLSP